MLPFDVLEIIMKFTDPPTFVQFRISNKNLYTRSKKYLNHKIAEQYPSCYARLTRQLNYGDWQKVIDKAKTNIEILQLIRKEEPVKILLPHLQTIPYPSTYLVAPFLEYLLESDQTENYQLAINIYGNKQLFYNYLLAKGSPLVQKMQAPDRYWRYSLYHSLLARNLDNLIFSFKNCSLSILRQQLVIALLIIIFSYVIASKIFTLGLNKEPNIIICYGFSMIVGYITSILLNYWIK